MSIKSPMNSPNFDNLLLQTLMGRHQARPRSSSPIPPPFLSRQSLQDLLLNSLSLSDSDSEDSSPPHSSKSQLAKEEAKLEKQIIRTILAGDTDALNPNSGQAVTVSDHHICVGFHQEPGSDYRVWEWHGHIMLFDDQNGYTPEYIYGNYFERVLPGNKIHKLQNVVVHDDDDKEEEEEDEKATNLGLKDLIDSGGSGAGRILHRNINAASPRF